MHGAGTPGFSGMFGVPIRPSGMAGLPLLPLLQGPAGNSSYVPVATPPNSFARASYVPSVTSVPPSSGMVPLSGRKQEQHPAGASMSLPLQATGFAGYTAPLSCTFPGGQPSFFPPMLPTAVQLAGCITIPVPLHLQRPTRPPCRILCYGDSLTVGFCDQGRHYEPYGRMLSDGLAQAGSATEVVVRGLSGSTAKDMSTQMDRTVMRNEQGTTCPGLLVLLQSEAPLDLVLIMAGTNDLGRGHSPKSTLESIRRLHDACHIYDIPTVVLAPPTVPVGPPRMAREVLATLLSDWAQSRPEVKAFIDAEELVPRDAASSFYDPDGLHFSPLGSQSLGKRLVPWLLPFVPTD